MNAYRVGIYLAVEQYARGTPDDFEEILEASNSFILLAGGHGFEPRQAESERTFPVMRSRPALP